MTTPGTLYGVGVGPGDPDLLTLKAVKVIAQAPVIAYPAAAGTESLARAIAAPHIPAGKTEIAIVTPMVPGRFPANDVYDDYARDIAGVWPKIIRPRSCPASPRWPPAPPWPALPWCRATRC